MFEWLSHPATVHVPIALGVLLPFAHLGLWFAVAKGFLPPRVWWLLTGAIAAQVSSCLLAYATGMRSKPLSAAAPELLARHENLALLFCLSALLAVGLSTTIAAGKRPASMNVRNAFLFAVLVAQMTLAIWVGRLGGTIVFG
jgi:hypothetical protein